MFFFNRQNKLQKKVQLSIDHLKHMVEVNMDELSIDQIKMFEEIIVTGESLKEKKSLDQEATESYAYVVGDYVLKTFNWRTRSMITLYLDVIVVAIMVAMGIRALALQPFKIPTGSMQPTLYGVHYIPRQMPDSSNTLLDLGGLGNLLAYNALEAKYVPETEMMMTSHAPETGLKSSMLPSFLNALVYGPYTKLTLQTLDSTPEIKFVELPGDVAKVRQYLSTRHLPAPEQLNHFGPWKPNEALADGYLAGGDHLFVDRLSHHFVGFNRGDVVVFNTENLSFRGRPLKYDGYYYIKRLVGLPKDTLRIRNHQLEIRTPQSSEFVPITKIAPVFNKLYSFKGGYHGHIGTELLANGVEFTVPDDSYFVLGDNSRSSLDGRYWGAVPQRNMIGKAAFIFWPFSRRFGLADRENNTPDVPTHWQYSKEDVYNRACGERSMPAMGLQ